MRKSVSNVVAGGLITSATVMGLDAVSNPASAALMETKQLRDFTFSVELNTADGSIEALTCCDDIDGDKEFVFDGFDRKLGELTTVVLDLPLLGLVDEQGNTCCPSVAEDFLGKDFESSGMIAGNTVTNDIVLQILGGEGFTFDGSQFMEDFNTAGLDFSILFGDNKIFSNGENKGTMTLSYIYEASPVPLPGAAALMAPALAAMLAARAFIRRRREQDE